jgi:hypothetical protein
MALDLRAFWRYAAAYALLFLGSFLLGVMIELTYLALVK